MTGIVARLLEPQEGEEEPAAPGAGPGRPGRWAAALPVLLAAGVLAAYVVFALVRNDVPPPERAGLPPLAHWDGEWYLDIAQFGYGEGGRTNPAFRAEFFPLFPTLAAAIHAVLPFVPLDVAGSGLNILLVLAGVALVDRVARRWPLSQRCLLALLLVTVPNAFFFVCFYGEAVLAACAAVVIWGLRRPGGLRWAAVGAALGALTRPVGFLLAVPVLLTVLRNPTRRASVTATATVAAGMAVLFSVYQLAAGSPIAFVHAQFGNPEWRDLGLGRYGPRGAWTTVRDAFVGPGWENFGSQPLGVIMLGVALLFAALAWRWDRRLAVGAVVLVLGPLWFQPLSALARYLVPTWFAWVGGFAAIRHSRAARVGVAAFAAFGLWCNFRLLDRFLQWSFVG